MAQNPENSDGWHRGAPSGLSSTRALVIATCAANIGRVIYLVVLDYVDRPVSVDPVRVALAFWIGLALLIGTIGLFVQCKIGPIIARLSWFVMAVEYLRWSVMVLRGIHFFGIGRYTADTIATADATDWLDLWIFVVTVWLVTRETRMIVTNQRTARLRHNSSGCET